MSPRTFKHFQILELLGKGGMGEVYLARDGSLERQVALKFLPRELLRDPSAQGRLLDEARSISRVQHPNIAVIHSIEEEGGIYALCMEYVDGRTLREIIAQGPAPLHRIVRIGAEIAAAMHAAHEQGIVHRDLKPANVMVTRRGEVKVMDFGLALRPERVVDTAGPNTYGTVQYMSPEQARGQKLDARSDIFSFGSTLYELITGRAPFTGQNDLAILSAIITQQADPLREHRRDIPPALEQLVRSCMAKDPAHRWPSMAAIQEELQYVEPVVEAGPKDLISELSTGLSDPRSRKPHRPVNHGAVGRRGSAPGVSPAPPARATGSAGPGLEIPDGFLVQEVRERRDFDLPAAGPSGGILVVAGPEEDERAQANERGPKGRRPPGAEWSDRPGTTPTRQTSGHRDPHDAEETQEGTHASAPVDPSVPRVTGERYAREIGLLDPSRDIPRLRTGERAPLDLVAPASGPKTTVGPAAPEAPEMPAPSGATRPEHRPEPIDSSPESRWKTVVGALLALLIAAAAAWGLLVRAGAFDPRPQADQNLAPPRTAGPLASGDLEAASRLDGVGPPPAVELPPPPATAPPDRTHDQR